MSRILNMKSVALFIIIVISFSLNSFVLADGREGKKQSPTPSSYTDYSVFSEDQYSQIEDNYLDGLNSDNIGLRTSSAYFLGEMKSHKAVISLLRLLKNGETEESRIIAALSLYKIGSGIGIYRIKGSAESDKSEKVKRVMDRLYKTYIAKKSF